MLESSIGAKCSSKGAMAAEEQDWMLCMLFAALGVALGSFLSSACPTFFALSTPSWPFSSFKDVSARCRKASSACCTCKIHGLQLCCNNTENMNGQRKSPFGICESQLDISQCPIDGIGKLDQDKSTIDSHGNESNLSQHQKGVSQHPFNDITKLEQGRNDCDAHEILSDVSWHPSPHIPIADGHGDNHVQSSELVIHSSIPSTEFTLPNGSLKPDPFNSSKRQGYLSWDDYFMAIAFLSAHRSKDPNRQVGACLVSQDRVILGIGYNGFPRGCSDDELPWAKMSANGDPLQTKYPYVCHAEVNAILNKNHASACGQRLYVTMFPCNECAKIIIQAGVAEVVYFIGKNSSLDCSYVASRKLLSLAGVKVWQHQPAQQKVILDFK